MNDIDKRRRTYRAWRNMLARCTNRKHRMFKNYGGRGISVCERWKVFANFLADLGLVPDGLTLERIDNERGYSPDNCKWATYKEQSENRRNSRLIEHNGKTLTIQSWERELHLASGAIHQRLKRGWSVARALTPSERPSPLIKIAAAQRYAR